MDSFLVLLAGSARPHGKVNSALLLTFEMVRTY